MRLESEVVIGTARTFALRNVGDVAVSSVTASLNVSGHALCRIFRSGRALLERIVLGGRRSGGRFLRGLLTRSAGMLRIVLIYFRGDVRIFRRAGGHFFRSLGGCPRIFGVIGGGHSGSSRDAVTFFGSNIRRNVFQSSIGFTVIGLLIHRRFSLLVGASVYGRCPFLRICRSVVFAFLHKVTAREKTEILRRFVRRCQGGEVRQAKRWLFLVLRAAGICGGGGACL